MLAELLLVLSIRFFLFDFKLFKNIREKLKPKNYFFKKLFTCTFCQGFWCGMIIYLVEHQLTSLFTLGEFMFISAIVCFSWTVAFYPLIRKYEKDSELPMT